MLGGFFLMWDCGNCQVQVKGRESGSRIRVRFVYDESGRRGRVGLGQAEGESIGFNDRGGSVDPLHGSRLKWGRETEVRLS